MLSRPLFLTGVQSGVGARRQNGFGMLKSDYGLSDNSPRPLLATSFPLAISLLAALLGSPSAWSLTVTSGPTLTLDPHGRTPLAAVVDLSTDVPARVTLEVSDGTTNRTLEFAEFKTEFSLPLLGLKPAKTYGVEVRLTDQNNEQLIAARALELTTEPLPDDFPSIKVLVSEPARMEPGYTIMARFMRAGGDRKLLRSLRDFFSPSAAELNPTLSEWICWAIGWAKGWGTCSNNTYTIIVDNAGDVVWYSPLGNLTNYQMEEGTLLYWIGSDVVTIDMLGNEKRRITLDDPGVLLSHDMFPTTLQTFLSITIQQRTVDNFPTSETDPSAPRRTANVEDNPIVEFDAQGNLLHMWSLVDMLDTTRIGYGSLTSRPGGLGYDWVHANSVVHDPRDDSIVISLRHQDAVVKFSRSTGELIWILGPHANWSPEFRRFLLTPVGEPFEWQYHQHAAEITSSGTILVFDNGNDRASPFDGKARITEAQNYSRAVEYAIDEQNMEIRQVWEYGKGIPETLYAGRIGDANRMNTTGNTLITFGGTKYTGGVRTSELGLGAISTRIIEVSAETPADKVFDILAYDPAPLARLQVYRSKRIPDLYPVDTDADGVPDYKDNCARDPNGPLIPGDVISSQLNTDGDEAGNVCDDDDDNDGMPDAYEVENQLNPLDRADAGLDEDGDGLSNLREYQLTRSQESTQQHNPAVH